MEYVEVKFSGSRPVYIDGAQSGSTNKILRVGSGTHAFDLGQPKDYQPAEVVIRVKDTSALSPLVIEFTARSGA
jgi:hypothetical protein